MISCWSFCNCFDHILSFFPNNSRPTSHSAVSTDYNPVLSCSCCKKPAERDHQGKRKLRKTKLTKSPRRTDIMYLELWVGSFRKVQLHQMQETSQSKSYNEWRFQHWTPINNHINFCFLNECESSLEISWKKKSVCLHTPSASAVVLRSV